MLISIPAGQVGLGGRYLRLKRQCLIDRWTCFVPLDCRKCVCVRVCVCADNPFLMHHSQHQRSPFDGFVRHVQRSKNVEASGQKHSHFLKH